jgi:protein-tyrosine phosphatase
MVCQASGVPKDRRLDWEGCLHARDLGGLRTRDGGSTRRGAVVRADAVDRLSPAGWTALEAHGVRTVVDLRNDDELGPDRAPRPAAVTTVHLPLDAMHDRAFWDTWQSGPQFGTPLYYPAFLERFPERVAAVVTAVACSAPGGVLVHCGRGRDRTGLISIVLLALAGVAPHDIAADYVLSVDDDREPELAAHLRERGTTAAELVAALAADLDAETYLRDAGVADDDLGALRARLTEPRRRATGG